MTSISINKDLKLTWTLIGHENYCFAEDKELYNIKTNRKVKHTVVKLTKGWCINGKFTSEKQIKKLLKRIPKEKYCPF